MALLQQQPKNHAKKVIQLYNFEYQTFDTNRAVKFNNSFGNNHRNHNFEHQI